MSVLAKTSYDIARSALGQQEQTLVDLRARTGILLTAASLVASFLGVQAITRSGLSALVVLALFAFGASVVLSVYVLLPRDRLVFTLDAPRVYEALYDLRDDEERLHLELANWIQVFRDRNQSIQARLHQVFEAASAALIFEIGFLALGIALR